VTLGAPATVQATRTDAATAPVSVVILTLNEEINIRACIESCAWCDDVHVLDSGSTDRTLEIAREMGAQVWEHPFESFSAQRNWAIDNIPVKHDWIFHLDADERFTPELVREMAGVLGGDPTEAGFHIPSKLMFMGRWLKRAGGYPTYQMRLFHRERMRFRDWGHGQREATEGRVGKLEEPYVHYAFSKGLYDWLDKHNRYSSLEALQVIASRHERPTLGRILSRDPVERRRAWKLVGYRLPFRPLMRWFVTLLLTGGILEGRPARTYASLLATYERMTTLKVRLLHRIDPDHPVGFEHDARPPVAADAEQSHRHEQRVRELQEAAAAADLEPHQLTPESSPWSFREKVIRAVWMLVGRPIFRLSFHNWYGVRRVILRTFGARIGRGVSIRPTTQIEIPWNLDIRDGVTVGDYAILYSLGKITIGERTIVSQYAHLCAGTHDYTDRRFKLIRDPITIGRDAWIGADAFVGPRVAIGALAVIGARTSVYSDLEGGLVYVGNPARPIKKRELQ
jgi:acetyltransferase-like isoleucine patch superfamily enzyme/glycosyltransferase involved in cell wall biosynthesis